MSLEQSTILPQLHQKSVGSMDVVSLTLARDVR